MRLNLESLPRYCHSAYRFFQKDERHVARVCAEDVLVVVFEGTLRFLEEDEPVSVEKATYYIQRAGLRQQGAAPGDTPQYYYIHFHGVFSPDAAGLPLSGRAVLPELFPLFDRLERLRTAHAAAVETHAVFYEILSVLARQMHDGEKRRVVEDTVAWAMRRLQDGFSLEDLARRCGYSRNYLIRIFRQETGLTPYAYLNRLKMEMARRLLADSEMPVNRIAQECGFGAYVNFYKEFVRAQGIAPLMWRAQSRGLQSAAKQDQKPPRKPE